MRRHILIAFLIVGLLAPGVRADDTEIYGTVTNPSLEPNVMILFDSSGSMATEDVPGDPYDPAQTFSGTYSADAVYYRRWNNYYDRYEWILLTGSINNIACATIKSSLQSVGYARGRLRSGTFACGGSNDVDYRLRMGNYLNYDASGVGLPQSRISVAQQVLTDLIATTDGVRFGMFVYNYNQGGKLVAPCGTDKATLLGRVASATPNGWTPLAETMAEIGLYFAGMPSWYNSSGFPSGTYSGGRYVSPMQQRCQKNYIIVMTDGEPTQDRDSRLWETPYINGDVIGDYDGDHNGGSEFDSYPDNGSDYLDDVAAYLYQNDCNPAMGDGTSFDKQNIVTYTIGFKTNQSLLQRTAAKGGGEYFTAENYSELKEAFDQIMSNIVEKNACYVAPVVPISRMNRVFAGDKIYLGFFKPQQSGRWIGNIKRYALQNDGTLLDVHSQPVTTTDGLIKDNAHSWWTTLGYDGPAVEKGGAAEALALQIGSGATRNVYTYTGTQALLSHSSNAFVSTNTAITNAMLNVADDPSRLSLIDSVRTGGFGDIIHSEPAVVVYNTKTIIYVGANDGLLHAIDDDTGEELWSFIPPDQLGRLWRLNDADHDYFVDGSPTVHYGASQKILVVGSRRGGHAYTALDITDYNAPRFLYSIGPTALGPTPTNFEQLGQSWARPDKITVATGSTVTTTAGCGLNVAVSTTDVFLFGGGYDINQDLPTPLANDTEGRGVFAVNMANGSVLNGLKFTPATHASLGLTHSVVDVSGFDHDGDGIASRIYFGDLGGGVFALRDDQPQTINVCGQNVTRSIVDGAWAGMKLFQAPDSNGRKLKILYAPDAVAELYPPGAGEYIYFGTGDRENPDDTAVVNRFYAVKNDWTASSTLTEADLVRVTDNMIQLGNASQKQAAKASLDAGKGWYIELENAGEKVVSSPRVYGGVVYFTTYTPTGSSGIDPNDPCAASTVRGVGRLYALNYKTGAAVHDFSSTPEQDGDNHTVTLGKQDRSLSVGTAIPSAPVIAILGGGARLFIGVEGGIVSLPTVATQEMYRYYWNQIF
ncbi:MAG: PilC/PilY family type IV pilus protein [Candidatus Nanopelagicales bacterium]|jgi:type IV pilus assembly protein PilY1|nr:PilC/PilY family type IV pilus protein [Candidatus Nanopelagicales bacterium]